jgi:D-glycero-D-manno-heptose 1,7-bisphosphate phosphatase
MGVMTRAEELMTVQSLEKAARTYADLARDVSGLPAQMPATQEALVALLGKVPAMHRAKVALIEKALAKHDYAALRTAAARIGAAPKKVVVPKAGPKVGTAGLHPTALSAARDAQGTTATRGTTAIPPGGTPIGLERQLPEPAPDSIKAGRLTAKKVAQSADMVRYVVYIKGKPTFIDLMEKLNPATELAAPKGLLAGRRGVVITDRDGVLNKANAFLNKSADVSAEVMIPSALAGAKALDEAGIGLVIATNQGGYQTGKMSFEETIAVNARIAHELAAGGGHVDAIVICPFNEKLPNPGPQDIDARKPGPGLVVHGAKLGSAAGAPAIAMIGDQRTDGAAGQGAGLPFIAITNTETGRWQAELDAARRKNETLPALNSGADAYSEVNDFAAAAAKVIAAVGSAGTSDDAGALTATRETKDLPAAWLRAATEQMQRRSQEEPGYYDYRVALHGADATALLKAAKKAGAGCRVDLDPAAEILLANVYGFDELAASLTAFNVKTGAARPLGELDDESLEPALAWDGRSAPKRFAHAVLLPVTNDRWDSGDDLVGFDALPEHHLTTPLDFEALIALGPSQVPELGDAGAAFSARPAGLDFYDLGLDAAGAKVSIRSGDVRHEIPASEGTTFVAAGWSSGASIDAALHGLTDPRLDRDPWREADDVLSASSFGTDNARPLLWLKQSDGALRFIAFSKKPEQPFLLEVRTQPLLAVRHGGDD